MRDLKIALGTSRYAKSWSNKTIDWAGFCGRVSQTVRTSETLSEFLAMKHAQQDAIKDIGGFVGGHLRGGRRKKENVLSRSMLTLDLDTPPKDAWNQISQTLTCTACCYSTHKHRTDTPRLRLVIPLARDVSADEYQAVGRKVALEVGIDWFDDTTFEAERLMYWPSTSTDGDFFYAELDGPWLDPDTVLATYDDWRDVTTWPTSTRQSAVQPVAVKHQADPLAKPGIVGAFCRTYPVSEAIARFLPDVYEESATPGRYTYRKGESALGLVVYEDKFAYSHHGTDPAGGKELNAFDLVRIHEYRDLDEHAKPETAANRLPSYLAMSDLARGDEKVKLTLAKERLADAQTDFQDSDREWLTGLTVTRKGSIEPSLENLRLILENDPGLKGIVYNRLADGMEITGSLPWEHPSAYWRDADDAQLVVYVETTYKVRFAERDYRVALTSIADDRSYHPILQYLENLPPWDGTPRVDRLLVDYLGAADTPYVHAVTRKTLCAAVQRVRHPGCKFDSMLVLNGPQGIGKSTLISRLAGPWFSDSLNLSDTRDKTAAEKLQGYWILEIGELAGLRKAEVETLRSFLSRQNDIYRAAYGRRAVPHQRQCVFFGTTNAETGYLRDVTGNRRFWPVKTPGTHTRHSWEISPEEITQIWAETLTYVDAGESLFLEAEVEEYAKLEQREALESDEREGVVWDYLTTLLPDQWGEMGLFERREFLNGSEFGPTAMVGKHTRTMVSTMEIWCECFGKDRANLTRRDSNEIVAIATRLGWVRDEKKRRIPIYGAQWVFVPTGSQDGSQTRSITGSENSGNKNRSSEAPSGTVTEQEAGTR